MAKTKISAGLLLFRRRGAVLEVLLAHPGGPLWAKKDAGAWTIPKGEVDPGEDLLAAAKREFCEETGTTPEGPFLSLGAVVQKSGKIVHAWAAEGDLDPASLRSNEFEMEWPPRSGRTQRFPEIDRAEFFPVEEAERRINPAQAELIRRLASQL